MKKQQIVNIVLVITLLLVLIVVMKQQQKSQGEFSDFLLGESYCDVVCVRNKVIGTLEPAKVFEVKSTCTGTIEKLYVEVGDTVAPWTWVAKVIPSAAPEEIEQAIKTVKIAEIECKLEENNFVRKSSLLSKGGISSSELEKAESILELKKLELSAAQQQLKWLLDGYTNEERNTVVQALASGMVTTIKVSNGQFVHKTNTQTEGSTIAELAALDDFVFKGQIGEYELSGFKVGMPLIYTLNVYDQLKCKGCVTRLFPKPSDDNSAVFFNFEASIDFPLDSIIPMTGITVIAEYIYSMTDSVVCIDEKFIQYDENTVFVERMDSTGNWRKQIIELGISDGIRAEVRKGLKVNERIKMATWN